MKANELRLGNYICNEDYIVIVESIDKDGCIVNFISDNVQGFTNNKGIEPIPLTEEWLLKMGGKKVNNLDWCIMFGGIEFYCRYNKFWYCSIGSVYLSDRIQFVHQVQNLYFSITNQELTMK
jgi:hypothetical protein